jgi:putative toxin-antitoxin system antitoxin component (TIGR02293 family)
MASLAESTAHQILTTSLHIDLATVESGVAIDTLMSFLTASGLELKDVYDVVIPARTLTHRRARKEALSRDESDKFARVIRVYDHALRIFGSPEKTLRFLRLPKESLQGRSPLQMLKTDLGGRLVEDLLWQIADGVFV